MASRKEELKVDLVANDRLSKTVDDAAGKVDGLDGTEAKVELTADDKATETVEEATEAVDGLDGAEAEAELSADDQASAAAEAATDAVEALDDVNGVATADLDDNATDAAVDVQDAVEALDDVNGVATADLDDNATGTAADAAAAVEALDGVTGTATVEVDEGDVAAVEDAVTAVEAIEGDHTGSMSIDGAEETSEVTGEIVGNLAEAFGAKGLVAAGVAGLVGLGLSAADQVADIESLSNAVGGTTEEVSALLDQWEFVGGSADSLEQSIIRVNDKLRDETNKLADQLGIEITDAKTPLDLFIEAVGVLNSDQLTANERLAAAMDLFGRKGVLTLNDLQTHVGDLETAMSEAGEEVLIHDSDVEAARGIRESWDALSDRVSELQRNLMPGLLPLLEQAATILDDALGGDTGNIAGIGVSEELQDEIDAAENRDDFWAGVVAATEDAADATTDAVAEMAAAAEEIPEVMSPVADAFEDAADKANDFADSLSTVFDPAMDLAEAEDQLHQNIQDLTVAVLQNGRSLTNNTEAGRKNRAQIRENVQGALDFAEAMVENGASAEDAEAFLNDYRAELVSQATQLGLNETAVDAYLTELGLTPENVATAIELTGDAAANRVIEKHNANLDKIPATVSSEIQAALRAGDIDEANRLLDSILDPSVRVRVHIPALPRITYVNGAPGYDYTGGTGPIALARGALVRGGTFTPAVLGDRYGRSGDEVVLPLGDPGRMAALLGMPDVGSRVAAALGMMAPAGTAGGSVGVGGGATYHVTVNMPPGSNGDDVLRALQQLQRTRGPLPLKIAG